MKMPISNMKIVFQIAILVVSTSAYVSGRCTTAEIHSATSKCLTTHLVEHGTDPLVPVLNNSAAVVNFCMRHISDIKQCITKVLSACTSDKRVKVIFGTTGAALLAAYDGICKEKNKTVHLTCANEYAEHISMAVHELIDNVDSMGQQTASFQDLCTPVHMLLDNITEIYEDAVHEGHCSAESMHVMYQYMSTIVFPCSDIATKYYPCTLSKINADAIECYAKNGVFVSNALVPTPDSRSNADEMCGARGNIHLCLTNLITQCMYEPQVTTLYGTALKAFEAAFNCLCSLDKADEIISCASTANISSSMAEFTTSIHNHSIMGTWNDRQQCDLENTMAAHITTALDKTCKDNSQKQHWQVYVNTVIYPCTQKATICYPSYEYSGAGRIGTMYVLGLSILALFLNRSFILM